jgi:hypothetical protein
MSRPKFEAGAARVQIQRDTARPLVLSADARHTITAHAMLPSMSCIICQVILQVRASQFIFVFSKSYVTLPYFE